MSISHWRFILNIKRDLARIITQINESDKDLSDLEILIILLEDRRFFQHLGIDVLSIAREIFKILTFRKYGGASTIDMQFVRMRTGYRDRTLRRKIYEMLLAYLLQLRMDKIQILRGYLREMFLGSGIYGIESCARVMFNKSSHQLDREQSSVIAAMMVYPRPRNPLSGWDERVKRRARYGLKLFDRLGYHYKRSLP